MKKSSLTLAALIAATAFADNTLTHGTSVLFQGSTSLGTFNTQAECVAAAQARVITTQTAYQCRENLTTAPIPAAPPPPPPALPSVTLSATPGSVAPGAASTLSWSSTNATGCVAGGSWSGTKATGGSQLTSPLTADSTFSLSCTGAGGTGNASTRVTVAAAGSMTGLEFAGVTGSWDDVRFKFTGANLLPMQSATYIWNLLPKQQANYYVTFFHAPETLPNSNSFYGAHPYPSGGVNRWEIAANFRDFTNDANGNNTVVQYNRWHTQALTVVPSGGSSVLTFYWDLPDTSRRITATVPLMQPAAGQVLGFGAAPWAVPNERLKGVLRGVRLYSASLSIADILSEADSPLSTSAGAAAIWYLNMNPTPSDISDKSGRGHNPAWVGSARATLWTQ